MASFRKAGTEGLNLARTSLQTNATAVRAGMAKRALTAQKKAGELEHQAAEKLRQATGPGMRDKAKETISQGVAAAGAKVGEMEQRAKTKVHELTKPSMSEEIQDAARTATGQTPTEPGLIDKVKKKIHNVTGTSKPDKP